MALRLEQLLAQILRVLVELPPLLRSEEEVLRPLEVPGDKLSELLASLESALDQPILSGELKIIISSLIRQNKELQDVNKMHKKVRGNFSEIQKKLNKSHRAMQNANSKLLSLIANKSTDTLIISKVTTEYDSAIEDNYVTTADFNKANKNLRISHDRHQNAVMSVITGLNLLATTIIITLNATDLQNSVGDQHNYIRQYINDKIDGSKRHTNSALFDFTSAINNHTTNSVLNAVSILSDKHPK